MKFLIKEIKSSFFYAIDCQTNELIKIEKKGIKKHLIEKMIIVCQAELCDYMGCAMKTYSVKKITKILISRQDGIERKLIESNKIKIGEIIDGKPVIRLGKEFVSDGKVVRYIYFK